MEMGDVPGVLFQTMRVALKDKKVPGLISAVLFYSERFSRTDIFERAALAETRIGCSAVASNTQPKSPSAHHAKGNVMLLNFCSSSSYINY